MINKYFQKRDCYSKRWKSLICLFLAVAFFVTFCAFISNTTLLSFGDETDFAVPETTQNNNQIGEKQENDFVIPLNDDKQTKKENTGLNVDGNG
ncbi:MAG: hypothetical protein MJ054_01190 [Clostridia bacterium]|nr:hypothetical protein [Clostridia bacterium]